jgi:hypothetical protein
MKQYSNEDLLSMLDVKYGTEEEQAAAIAVVVASIRESRRLGRIALRKPKSSWHRNPGILREGLSTDWGSSARAGLQ